MDNPIDGDRLVRAALTYIAWKEVDDICKAYGIDDSTGSRLIAREYALQELQSAVGLTRPLRFTFDELIGLCEPLFTKFGPKTLETMKATIREEIDGRVGRYER